MANYLMKYKGSYRLKAPFNQQNNQFSRKLDGTLEDIDVVISCRACEISHYGKSILQVWFPSAVKGRNAIKAIVENLSTDICFDIVDNESELLFKFNSKYMEQLEPYLKPKTGGASISPFSNKNLIKLSYTIPENDLIEYKNAIKNVQKNQLIFISHATTKFLKSICNKRNTYENLKNDMKLKCIKGKEYIHSIGKWKEYIKYLNKELERIIN